MTEYLVVSDKQAAIDKSRSEALRRGCGPVTLYWWSVVEHPTNKTAALMIVTPDDKVALSSQEINTLATKASLNAAGWFPAVAMVATPQVESVP